MTNQSGITPDDLAVKWSIPLNQAFVNIIMLEKQIADQDALIQKMTASQIALEVELAELKKSPHTLSRIAAGIAAEGSAIITDAKEKAAP